MNIVSQRRSRASGTVIFVIDNRDRSFDADDPNGWFNLCDDHGNIVSHSTRRLAEEFGPVPAEWCPDCQAEAET